MWTTLFLQGVHRVDLGESFQTHIFLQKFASIQPRTSLVNFSRSSNAAACLDAVAGKEKLGIETGERFTGVVKNFEHHWGFVRTDAGKEYFYVCSILF